MHRKQYTLTQKLQNSILNQLKYHKNKLSSFQHNDYENKIHEYECKLNNQKNSSYINEVPAADKERKFKLIVISKDNVFDVKSSLSTDFLFYLKEIGNKVDHFDEEILHLILLNDLNINITEINNEEIDDNDDVEDKKVKNEKIILMNNINNNVKYKFKGEELIDMMKNPLHYHKREISISKLCSPIYEKMDEIKKNYLNNKRDIKDLMQNINNMDIKIKELIETYTKYFNENNINVNDIEILIKDKNKYHISIEKNMKLFLQIIDLHKKINDKKIYFNKIDKELYELNSIKKEKEKQIDIIIEEVKNEIKRDSKLINISDTFNEYKEILKSKIQKEEEYKDYKEVFNMNNINNFKIEDFYSFLDEHLNKSEYTFSIIKITNFNFLVEVINDFNELGELYNKDLDINI